MSKTTALPKSSKLDKMIDPTIRNVDKFLVL